MTEHASSHTTDRVSAEFHTAANRVRALVQRLPGGEFGEDRAYLLAVSAYLEGLAPRAPRGEVGGRLRLIGDDTRQRWLNGNRGRR